MLTRAVLIRQAGDQVRKQLVLSCCGSQAGLPPRSWPLTAAQVGWASDCSYIFQRREKSRADAIAESLSWVEQPPPPSQQPQQTDGTFWVHDFQYTAPCFHRFSLHVDHGAASFMPCRPASL